MRWLRRVSTLSGLVFGISACAAATTPVLTLISPAVVKSNGTINSGDYYGSGPVHIVASAISPDCGGGISAIEINPSDNYIAYESHSSYVDTQLALTPTYYSIVIKAFDNCGGVGFVVLNTYLQSSSGTVSVSSPVANLRYSSPVQFFATATTECSKGVAAMGIYTGNHQLAYTSVGPTLNDSLNLAPGTYNLAIQEWDGCGGAANTLETITVAAHRISNTGIVSKFAYIPRTGSPWIDGYWINPNSCALSATAGSPYPAHFKPYGTAADPFGQLIYGLNQDSQDVNVYILDQNTGGVTQVVESPLQVPQFGSAQPTAIAADPTGQFVYVAGGDQNPKGTRGPGVLTAYRLADRNSGTLTLVQAQLQMLPDANGTVIPNSMVVRGGKGGEFLYTSNGSSVSGFAIEQSTGKLTELHGSPFPANGHFSKYADTEDVITDVPADFRSGEVLHIFTANAENSISAWTSDSTTGELTEIAGSPWPNPSITPPAKFSPASITIDSLGTYIFGLDAGGNQISVWSVDPSTGVVTFQRAEHNGEVIPDPLDKMRVVPETNCMVTSGADALSFDPTTGVTRIVPGSPFALAGSGQEPGIAIAP